MDEAEPQHGQGTGLTLEPAEAATPPSLRPRPEGEASPPGDPASDPRAERPGGSAPGPRAAEAKRLHFGDPAEESAADLQLLQNHHSAALRDESAEGEILHDVRQRAERAFEAGALYLPRLTASDGRVKPPPGAIREIMLHQFAEHFLAASLVVQQTD